MIMKNKLLSFGIVGLTGVLLSSFVWVQRGHETQEPKKSRHIKMIKVENGKKMELDTVLTGDGVFVWNGDTINPVKHSKRFSPSGFDKMHHTDVNVDHQNGNEKVMIIKHRGGKKGEPMIWNMDSGDDMDMKHFPPMPPMPPMPPVPHMKMMKMKHSGQIIDLNDPNIISFKKKEMSGDREKIEIIRKKSGDNENATFNFKFDDELMVPEAPDTPEFNWKSDGDSIHMKIIERKKVIKGKDGKEIEVKVETEENK